MNIYSLLFMGLALLCFTEARAADLFPMDTVRLGWLVDSFVQASGVPGAAVALVREGKTVWTHGTGVTNTISREPVTAATIFPAASIGKPVFALALLTLVDREHFALDQPLAEMVPAWEGSSPWPNRITARHVLTHTSGLSNWLADRTHVPKFESGTQFSYSGLGFGYLQQAVRSRYNLDLDALVARSVFRRLEMQRSFFDSSNNFTDRARGHVEVGYALAPFSILYLPALAAVALLALLLRLFTRRRMQGYWLMLGIMLLPAVPVLWFLIRRSGQWTIPLYFAGVTATFLAIFFAVYFLFDPGLRRSLRRKTTRRITALLIATLALCALIVGTRRLLLPLPDSIPPGGHAASSFHTSASDLAHFLEELIQPTLLLPELARQMTSPQVTAGDQAWGLGIGIERADDGRLMLWHWGSNPGAKGLIVAIPEERAAVAVLTNGPNGSTAVREIAAAALGVRGQWAIP